ncbi:efflux RND transporter periplasmic adaptor subunit [Loktanella sp. D2R18]|uniref:efflux RND transporter periplasmic adaptor subunit n=1 Tax=Rhodobacterales TaxID=204455 RepID=UPI000DE9D505|nr:MULTISPECIES: efflux RND transporter periplasmic adaptor subunit [Rhodobacterales]MDO6592085.1 efflux RND transporter periplasmic adaptor subunit [Yoonia sp. 1_MG-2023]RBW43105.1 efflux RND transporter periplasmic adaptor subunit [Loktanella sp. D2R18]
MSQDGAPNLTGKLTFDGDKGAGRSKWVAILMGLAMVGWMGSGQFAPEAPEEETAEDAAPSLVTVAVIPSVAQDVQLVLTAEGQSTPDRSTQIRAKANGQIMSVLVERGDLVTAGQEIGRIDAETIEAQVLQAQTQLAQATRDYNNAVALQDRGLATEDRVSAARAAEASAEAAVTAVVEQLDNTIITAPFAGRLNDMTLDEGEFVNNGDAVAEVLDNDPLTVVVQVPQQALSRLNKGDAARVSFITGEERAGVIGFIGSNADAQTRTFRVEVTVDNPNSEMPAGLSARIEIPTGQARGHFISPAILSLGTSGDLGVKTVAEGNIVAFSPVTIVRAQPDGIWVTGLPEAADIISVGQGFVTAGDRVNPQPPVAAQSADASQ